MLSAVAVLLVLALVLGAVGCVCRSRCPRTDPCR